MFFESECEYILHFLCAGLETNLVDSTDLFKFTSDNTWKGIFLLNRDTQLPNEKKKSFLSNFSRFLEFLDNLEAKEISERLP